MKTILRLLKLAGITILGSLIAAICSLLYLENSPLFHLPYVTTPLFLMANDKDDAVPWYQGIELFIGMRLDRVHPRASTTSW